MNYFNARDPERMERLWQRIQGYRALLAEYHVKDEAVQARVRRPLRRARVRRPGGGRGRSALASWPSAASGGPGAS